jgi:hypothetical protein
MFHQSDKQHHHFNDKTPTIFLHLHRLNDFQPTESPFNRIILGHAVAQATSSWLPTAVARVYVQAACGVCGGQSSTGAGFLRVLRFPQPIIPPISPSS